MPAFEYGRNGEQSEEDAECGGRGTDDAWKGEWMREGEKTVKARKMQRGGKER